MMTGKDKPTLCKHCDEEKLARHVAMFMQTKIAAQNE